MKPYLFSSTTCSAAALVAALATFSPAQAADATGAAVLQADFANFFADVEETLGGTIVWSAPIDVAVDGARYRLTIPAFVLQFEVDPDASDLRPMGPDDGGPDDEQPDRELIPDHDEPPVQPVSMLHFAFGEMVIHLDPREDDPDLTGFDMSGPWTMAATLDGEQILGLSYDVSTISGVWSDALDYPTALVSNMDNMAMSIGLGMLFDDLAMGGAFDIEIVVDNYESEFAFIEGENGNWDAEGWYRLTGMTSQDGMGGSQTIGSIQAELGFTDVPMLEWRDYVEELATVIGDIAADRLDSYDEQDPERLAFITVMDMPPFYDSIDYRTVVEDYVTDQPLARNEIAYQEVALSADGLRGDLASLDFLFAIDGFTFEFPLNYADDIDIEALIPHRGSISVSASNVPVGVIADELDAAMLDPTLDPEDVIERVADAFSGALLHAGASLVYDLEMAILSAEIAVHGDLLADPQSPTLVTGGADVRLTDILSPLVVAHLIDQQTADEVAAVLEAEAIVEAAEGGPSTWLYQFVMPANGLVTLNGENVMSVFARIEPAMEALFR